MPKPEGSFSPAPLTASSASAAAAGPATARPAGPAPVDKDTTAGILFGIGAYGLWGLLPLYFYVLHPAGAVEIVANRVVWSLLFCVLLITITRSWRVLGSRVPQPHVTGPLSIAAGLIAVNWLTYTYGVTTGQAVEASLGYFINPLVSVLLGVFVLEEKLRPLQWAAVGIGFIAVGVLTVSDGTLVWIALTLALSFGLYGFVKKRVGPRADAITSLTVETIVLAPLAAATMIFLADQRGGKPGHQWCGSFLAARGLGRHHCRAAAVLRGLRPPAADDHDRPAAVLRTGPAVHRGARRLQGSDDTGPWIGFGVVWLALLVLTVDMLHTAGKNSLTRKLARAAA